MTFWDGKKILLTGGSGFLGSHIVDGLLERGVSEEQISIPNRKELDLRIWNSCVKATEDIDIVIHLAANVGGIGYNKTHPGDIFYDNTIMGIQLIEAARQAEVEKCVIIGTACSYPKSTPLPFNEDNLWNGYPEGTNSAYCVAKKTLLVQSQAYRKQYDFNSIFLLPVDLYGPRDNFEPERSHVIAALISKFVDAVRNDKSVVEVWGSGAACREFLYAKDAARGIIMAAEKYNSSEPVNLGTGIEISIHDVVEIIAEETCYDREIYWNDKMPEGRLRMCLDVSRAKTEFGFEAETQLKNGIKETVEWYLDYYKNI